RATSWRAALRAAWPPLGCATVFTVLTPPGKMVFLWDGQIFMSPNPSLDDLRIERSAPPGSKSRTWLIVLAVAIVMIGAAVWWFIQPKAVPVRTVAAREASKPSGSGPERTG